MSKGSESKNWLSQIFRQIGSTFSALVKYVKFGGPIGKQTLLGLACIFLFMIIAVRMDSAQLPYLIPGGLAVVVIVGVLNFAFAIKNPDLATLEGTEVITLRQQGEFGTEKQVLNAAALQSIERSTNPIYDVEPIAEARISGKRESADVEPLE